jgi:hypothetical protein
MRRQLLLLPMVVAIVVTFTLAGCGANPDALHTAVAAATRTLSGTAVSDVTLRGVNVFGKARATVFAKGAFVFRTGLGYERIDLPAVKRQGAARAYLVFLPTQFYFERRSSAGTVLYNGKSWVSAALTGAESVHTIAPRFVEQVESLTPQLLLDEIVWGGEAASHVGEPVVNHVPLSEYRVTVNLKRALSAATGPSSGAMRVAIEEELAALRVSRAPSRSPSVPVTVWVDGPGRVVRLQAALPGSGVGTISMSLSGFDVKLATSLPPPSQVLDITALTPSGGRTLRLLWVLGG